MWELGRRFEIPFTVVDRVRYICFLMSKERKLRVSALRDDMLCIKNFMAICARGVIKFL